MSVSVNACVSVGWSPATTDAEIKVASVENSEPSKQKVPLGAGQNMVLNALPGTRNYDFIILLSQFVPLFFFSFLFSCSLSTYTVTRVMSSG